MNYSMFIVLLVSAGIIASTTGLKCYQCDYFSTGAPDNEPKCQNETINDAPELLMECAEPNNGACFTASTEDGDITTVSRTCVSPDMVPEMGCTYSEILGIKVSVCYCDTDGCNGSTPGPGNGTNVATSL